MSYNNSKPTNNSRGGYNQTHYDPYNQFDQNTMGKNAAPQNYNNSPKLNHHVSDNSNISNLLHNLQEGDIIEFNNFNGTSEYAIFLGKVGTKSHVLYATPDIPQQQNHSPSLVERYVTGYSKSQELSFSNNSGRNPGVQRIKINQGPFDEIIQNRMVKKNNFEDVNLPANSPEAIVDRAMLKTDDVKASPHFQNSKDWVIWCRYGRDIIIRDIHVPSQLGFAMGSGKY